jgi:predicted nucleotidyltransferase
VSELEAAVRRVVAALRERGAAFAVVGGLAVSARTEPRFTRDADLCVSVHDDGEAEALIHGLRQEGYEVSALVEQEVTGRLATARLVDTRRSEGGVVVDLLFASSGIEAEVVEQAEDIELFVGVQAPVARIPALLALKILARDDRSRPQDRQDALGLMRVATAEDLEAALHLLRAIDARGYARGRDLVAGLEDLRRDAEDQGETP